MSWHKSLFFIFFTVQVINVRKSLPADRVDFSSFRSFKRTVEQIDLASFLLCYNDR